MKRVLQSSALESPTTTLSRDTVPIGDDIEPVGESRAGVEMGNEEEEEASESEIPAVGTNPKNLMMKAPQEREDCGHAVHKNWCVVCVRSRCVENNLQVELLKEDGRERTKLSMVTFDHVSVTQENSQKRRTESNESYVG